MMDEAELRHTAGSFCADELDSEERAAFEALMADDADIDAEVSFWDNVREEMPAALRPANARLPSAGLAEAIHARAAREQEAQAKVIRFPFAQAGWMLAAAAAGALAVLLIGGYGQSVDERTMVAFDQDGGGVVLPEGWWQRGTYADDNFMPVRSTSNVLTTKGETQGRDDFVSRPWLGLWTRPIHLRHEEIEAEKGLQVVRVVEGSPAWHAGVRPSDVLLSFGSCPMYSRYCIVHAFKTDGLAPGDAATLKYWRPGTDAIQESEIVLTALYE